MADLSLADDLDTRLWRALLSMQRHPWEQGIASHAAIDSGRSDLARLLGHDAIVRQDAEGRLGATGDTGLVNCCACGESVALLAREGDSAASDALDRQLRWLLDACPTGDSGILYHLEGRPEVWVDTVYMVVPLLVSTGHADLADEQFRLHRDRLRDAGTGLWGHIWDDAASVWVRSDPWASGNGWVAAGLARALRIGGATLEDDIRDRWRSALVEILEACSVHERPDGRFPNVLGPEETFMDGTAGLMFAFAAYTGVADGWLVDSWAASGTRWLNGALAHVDADGLVREVCGSPHFDRSGTSPEAQAFALLARSAARRLD